MDLHEVRAHGSARQRFQTERARAREQVEHARPTQRALQNGEPRLAHAVPGRPHLVGSGSLEASPPKFAGDDANHARPLPTPNAECGMRNAELQWEIAGRAVPPLTFRIP